jgi:hypothetical protein
MFAGLGWLPPPPTSPTPVFNQRRGHGGLLYTRRAVSLSRRDGRPFILSAR